MSHKVSEYSQLGGSLSTQPHSGIPITQVEVRDSWEDILLPLQQNYAVGQQVTFEAPQTSQYTDFSKSYVRIRGNWQQTAGGGLVTDSDFSAPVVNFPSALFNSVQLFLNNKQVSPNRGGDTYISFVDRLVLGRRGAFQNSIQAPYYQDQAGAPNYEVTQTVQDFDQGFSLDQLDTCGFANLYANYQANATLANQQRNVGADMRGNRVLQDTQYVPQGGVAGTGISEYIYQPVLGAWKLDKLLPDLVKIRLQLTIADPAFYTTTGGAVGAQPWSFVISSMEMVLHRTEMSMETVRQNTEAMLVRPWVAPTYMMEYSSQAFTGGGGVSLPITISNLYSGSKPKFVLVGFQDYLSTTNNTNYNPYYMSEGGDGTVEKGCFASQLAILVNSKQIPPRRPYQPLSPVSHVRDYRALAELNIDGFPAHSTALINYMQYCLNYTWYVFVIDSISDMDVYSPTEDVVIDVQGTLSAVDGDTLVAGNIICHMISYVPAVLKCDASRNCEIVSKSGVPITYQ